MGSGKTLNLAAERIALPLGHVEGKMLQRLVVGLLKWLWAPRATPRLRIEQLSALENPPSGCHGSRSGMGATFIPMEQQGAFLIDTD